MKKAIKRCFDVIVSLVALVILFPIILLVSLLVRAKLGSPILFSQKRVGKNNKIFTMIKFRTMNDRRNSKGELLPDELRLTGFGKFLRSTSLDELPELINIVKGDMSLVGPRPLLVEYLDKYNDEQIRRHDMLPGLTGWDQINGRNNLSWSEKFDLDIWYIDNWSLLLDLKIIFKTFVKVFQREGISHEGYITMEKFDGFN